MERRNKPGKARLKQEKNGEERQFNSENKEEAGRYAEVEKEYIQKTGSPFFLAKVVTRSLTVWTERREELKMKRARERSQPKSNGLLCSATIVSFFSFPV